MITLGGSDPDLLAKQAVDGLHRIRWERQIQRRLIEQPELLADAGLKGLTLVKHEFLFANGRRADLVYTQGSGPLRRNVIIELKRGEIGARAVAQVVDYAGLLRDDPRATRRRPLNVVIGSSLREDAMTVRPRGRRPRFISLERLRIERA